MTEQQANNKDNLQVTEKSQLTLIGQTRRLLEDLHFEKLGMIDENPSREAIYGSIADDIFDRDLRIPPTQIVIPDRFSNVDPLITEHFQRSREPLYVLKGTLLESLLNVGGKVTGTFDITNLNGANDVSIDNGDLLLFDTAHQVRSYLDPQTQWLVRLRGDEFAIVSMPVTKNIPGKRRIPRYNTKPTAEEMIAYVHQAQAVFLTTEGSLTLESININSAGEIPQILKKHAKAPTLDRESRLQRLRSLYPTAALGIDLIQQLGSDEHDQDLRWNLITLKENAVYDPKLHALAVELSQEFGTNLFIVSDRYHFLDQLATLAEPKASLVRINVPGTKIINDDPLLGQDEGDSFIMSNVRPMAKEIHMLFQDVSKVTNLPMPELRFYVSGPDIYFLVPPGTNPRVQEAIIRRVKNGLPRIYEMKHIPKVRIPVLPGANLDSMDWTTNDIRTAFIQYLIRSRIAVWKEDAINFLRYFYIYYQDDLNISFEDQLFLAKHFMENNRGRSRFDAMEIPSELRQNLWRVYPPESRDVKAFILDEKSTDLTTFLPEFMNQMKPIFDYIISTLPLRERDIKPDQRR